MSLAYKAAGVGGVTVPTVIPELTGGCKYRYSFLRASSRTLGY
jgi:hypothetical protein